MDAKLKKYAALIAYFKSHNYIIDWREQLPPEIYDLMPDAILDGIVGSYGETETYMLEISWEQENGKTKGQGQHGQ